MYGSIRERLLPFHSEVGQSIEERRNMIRVTVADIVQQEKYYAIVLLDEAGRRILPIWVGEPEARAIAACYLERPVPRPWTHDLMANLLEAAGTALEEVRVETLKEITFYAVVKLRSGDTTREVDARPSDAIALALRMNSPIYVAEEVLKEEGLDIPEELGPTPQGRGLEKIRDKIEKETRTPQQKLLDIVFGKETET